MGRARTGLLVVTVVGAALMNGCVPREVGDACDNDGQCATNSCFLVCRVNDCATDADCGGQTCEITLDGDDPVGAVCVIPSERGQQCSFADRTRTVTRGCVDGLACETIERGQATVGICVPPEGPRLLSEPCSDAAACDAGLDCVDTQPAGDNGVCSEP